ncbi:hypothetical protein SAMD00019534_025340 [Acytostelium subglobosum LB1]|uniref:hypothetical protein n=1 Tax=Acytostelium subglobosum LB1 TaxID=1410327 RepID=UPI000644C553|nr:hypothetical protein SAMD00019534_025340 [Acytostelium subglobosum LB1]GAM19359.1 hypothetical protein SAMD00019534_025340 [Acytostelium subglobosum LB1]|eukprot:XP_012757286.1 hypothetical protein SAMD00019534_025340 [Acytostelium subglobosum LB1]
MQENDNKAPKVAAATAKKPTNPANNPFFVSYIKARAKVYPADKKAMPASRVVKMDANDDTEDDDVKDMTNAEIAATLANFTVFHVETPPHNGPHNDPQTATRRVGGHGGQGGAGNDPDNKPDGNGHPGGKPGGGGRPGGDKPGGGGKPDGGDDHGKGGKSHPGEHVNIVKANAEKYFLENVLYFTEDNVLELFEQTKPTLSAKRLAIVNDANEQKWYKDYSNLLFTMKVANGDDDPSRRILKDKVEADLQAMCDSQIYAHQTMLLQTFAFIEKYPKMEDFLEQPARCANIYVNYWSDETNLAAFCTSFQDDRVRDGFDPTASIYRRITSMKIVLDILDPTCVQSTKLINRITHTAMANYYDQNMTNNQNSNDIINLVIKDLLTKLNKDPKSEFYALMKHMTSGVGTFPGFIAEMQEATRAVMYQVYDETASWTERVDAYAERIGASIINKLKTKLAANLIDKSSKIFFSSLLRVCQAAAVTYGFLNKDNLKDGEKLELIGETSGLFLDTVTMFKTGNKLVTSMFARTGIFVGSKLAPLVPTVVAKIVPKCLSVIFTANAAKFMLNRFSPVLLLVASYNLVVDAIEDVKQGNVGALLLDLTALGVTLAAAVALFVGTSWSGPFALVASGLVVVFALMKFLFFTSSPQEQFFRSYVNSKYKKAMPIIGGMGG